MKNKKKIYTIIAISLIVCYAAVVYWALNANVCLDYKAYLNKVNDWPRYNGLKYKLEDTLALGTKENGGRKVKYCGPGWSGAEEWGIWTEGKRAHLYFILDSAADTDLKLIMQATGFSPGGRLIVDVFGNETLLETLHISHMTFQEYNVTIPQRIASMLPLHLELVVRNPSSPSQHGLSKDKRLLGLGVSWVKILPQSSVQVSRASGI